MLYRLSKVTWIRTLRTRRGTDQIRSRAPAPMASDGALTLTDARRCEGGKLNHKKYSNIAVSAMASCAQPIRITQAPWRRSDRAFRSRDLDFHRTVTGGLKDVALGWPARAWWSGVVSTGRPPGLYILSTHPYRGPGATGPVTGGSRGRRYGLVDPLLLSEKRVGKGLR